MYGTGIADRIEAWNALLPSLLTKWSSLSSTASTTRKGTSKIFSSFAVFADILTYPEEHGFEKTDPRDEMGGIWVDGLHATSDVHEILALEMEAFLSENKEQDERGLRG